MRNKLSRLLTLMSVVGLLVASAVFVFSLAASAELTDGTGNGPDGQPAVSHRFIVELQSAPLALQYKEMVGAQSVDGKLDANSTVAQSYMQQLQAEQAAFVAQMQRALPNAKVSTYIDENGISNQETFQVVLNAVVVDAGFNAGAAEMKVLSGLPGVKTVYRDYKYYPQLYTSTHLINAPVAWGMLGGQAMAGKGIKVASVDGGIHKDAPMFDGTGWSYPAGYPANGLGLTSNNNGKIIASRAYFRWWDPPAAGDENPWPGVNGTSHGVHTSSTAAGNVITDGEYVGSTLPPFSGVAPGAWLMSYRVFYSSVLNDGSFHTAEGVAALEDMVKDGADVVNNSWGGGPGGVGAPFDAIDNALVNAAKAGVFVSMSNGNAGPNLGTGDHPSPEYINVAASTTSGTYASGRVGQSGPTPISDTTKYNVAFATFGGSVPLGQELVQDYIAAAVISPTNTTGCTAFGSNAFQGKTAVISRGGCEFGLKALNAEQAGASFVVIYNNAGDSLINMGGGAVGDQVTIPAIFVGQTGGTSLASFAAAHPNDAKLVVDTQGFQAGATPDLIASFSSRGPSTRNSLKPDIAAPGVNIMAQGYTIGATGEARHLGYGQASGTSMASPHVAGSAALLRQKYPTWSNDAIKSALMSTSKYMDMYNFDASPAQPTDMGAGRLDVGAAMDPGVILAPPAADFGLVYTGTAKLGREIKVTNVTGQAETYNISTLYTGNGFAPTQTTSLAGVTVTPASLTLAPGETKSFTVGFDPALGTGMGINQGYIVMQGTTHKAHLPFFGRVVAGMKTADVLLIDNDGSSSLGMPNYASYYGTALDNLGYSYDYLDTDASAGSASSFVPDISVLKAYTAVLIFTGDNFYSDGSFTVPTPLTGGDMNRLNEYVQAGGKIIVMGQDASWVMGEACGDGNGSFFYGATLGGSCLQDSVSAYSLPTLPVEGHAYAPPRFFELYLDLTDVNHAVGSVVLSGLNETTPVTNSVALGTANFSYDNFTGKLAYNVEISVTDVLTLTAAHIHSGTVGTNGGVIFPTFPFTQPQVVTSTIEWNGSVTLTPEQNAQREAGGMYFNVHSTVNGGGELRGQVPSTAIKGDGAANQAYIDEMASNAWGFDPSAAPYEIDQYMPLLRYPGSLLVEDGTVAVAHRDQPTLERPGTAGQGATVFTAFGLEGVNNGVGTTSRETLLKTFWNYLMDEPTATISHTADITTSQIAVFHVNLNSNVPHAGFWAARWDWGDGSPYTGWTYGLASHHYVECGTYTVRAEVSDAYGNSTIATSQVNVTACEVPVTGTVTAGTGGQLRSDDGTFLLDFPAGAVSGNTTVSVAKQSKPSAALGGLAFAGNSIVITAKDANGNPVTTFAQPFTLVVKYQDSDWQNAGITDETNLNVYFYKDGVWSPLFPCAGCSHDTVKNEFTLKLDHLTEFAVAGVKYRLVLPELRK
ncbi:MAG: S8 family serine peptidase [Caldilineaceae bacterium]|nr:S8 family serine peptidase [Caldilineaceae bacterium]